MNFCHMKRRSIVQCVALPFLIQLAQASNLSEIKIVSSFPAGASVDFWARRIESEFRGRLAVDTLVTYAPGASGIIAANLVRRVSTEINPALMIASSSLFSIMPRLSDSNLSFDPNKAFQPVSILWTEPFYLAVRADSPIQTLEDLLARSRRSAMPPSFGSTGSKSTGALLMEHMATRHDLSLTHVPYKGMGEVITSMLGGQIDFGVVSYQPIRGLLQSGKVRLLATTGRRRSKNLPQCPSLREFKLLDIDGSVWFGLFALAELSSASISTIREALAPFLSSDEFRAETLSNGFTPLGLFGKEADRFIKESNEAWGSVLSSPSR